MADDAFFAEHTISADKTVGWLESFTDELKGIPEVTFWYTASERYLRIIVVWGSDYYHGRCPHASHSFCHGWIVRGIVEMIESWLGPVKWKKVEYSQQTRRIIKTWDDDNPAPRELRKVDLHSGTPVTQ